MFLYCGRETLVLVYTRKQIINDVIDLFEDCSLDIGNVLKFIMALKGTGDESQSEQSRAGVFNIPEPKELRRVTSFCCVGMRVNDNQKWSDRQMKTHRTTDSRSFARSRTVAEQEHL